jgi:hypothetical protein
MIPRLLLPAALAGALATPLVLPAQQVVRAGQPVQGRLAPGDPSLPDGSRYRMYRYGGRAGDRIVITLRSREFDTYLSWGRMTGGVLRVEGSDDDSGGGTDSELRVTVGAAGEYAIRVGSYAPDEFGAYILVVQPAGRDGDGGLRPVTPRAGGWRYAYAPVTGARLRPVAERIRQQQILESVAERLNAMLPATREMVMRMEACREENAYFDPARNLIVFCYELVERLSRFFSPEGDWSRKQEENLGGAVSFILMHEVGHALVDMLDLPITGREEDAVDQLATVLMLETGQKGTRAALGAVLALHQPSGQPVDADEYAGVHSLGPQRFFNVLCWIYATDPPRYAPLVGPFLPDHRRVRCPAEYARFARAWERLLQPHRVR